MTSICSSGSSQPKPGLPTTLSITAAFAGPLVGVVYPWLGAAITAVTDVLNINLTTFCAVDPPADPGITATDYLAMLAFANNPFSSPSYDKFVQAILRSVWPSVCQCTSGGTYTPLPVVTAPTGLPAVNPPTVVPGSPTVACAVNTETGAVYAANQSNFLNYVGTNLAILGATSAQLDITCTPFVAPGGNVRFDFYQNDHTGTQLRLDTFVESATAHDVFSIPIVANCESTQLKASTGAISGSVTVIRKVNYFCGNAVPGGTQSPCCPPDPTLIQRLDNLTQLVTLIQRQSTPFAYILGTAHAGLTGTGTLAVSGILGLLVTLTTIPTQIGDRVGTPPRLFDAGWINLGTADGYEDPRWLSSSSQIILPRAAGVVTTVGYTFHAGVVATITPLVREP